MEGGGIVDIGAAFARSLELGLVVMVAHRRALAAAPAWPSASVRGAELLFYVAVASLIVPSIVTSLGIALEFRLLDDFDQEPRAGLARRELRRPRWACSPRASARI